MKKPNYFVICCALLLAASATAFVVFFDHYSPDMLQARFCLADPSRVAAGGDTLVFLDDGGMTLEVLHGGLHAFSVAGGYTGDDGFYQALDATIDPSGNIYISDRQLGENGKEVVRERIIRFDRNGAYSDTLFTLEHPDAASARQLFGPDYHDGSIYFYAASDSGVEVYKYEPLSGTASRWIDFPSALDLVWDVVSADGLTYISTKHGEILRFSTDGEPSVVYSESVSDERFSVPTELAVGQDGTLYFVCAGLRKVSAISQSGRLFDVMLAGEPLSKATDDFAEFPQYSGLYVDGDVVLALYTSCVYNKSDEYAAEFSYGVFAKSNGSVVLNTDSFAKTETVLVCNLLLFASLVVGIITLCYLALVYAPRLLLLHMSRTLIMQGVILLTALATAAVTAYMVANETGKRYYNEVMSNMSNSAALLAEAIDYQDFAALNQPSDYLSDSYNRIHAQVNDFLSSSANQQRGIYCVAYRVFDGVVNAVFADDNSYGAMLPMPGGFSGSAEQEIYDTGKQLISYRNTSALGTYMFALSPFFDLRGDVIGLIEVGTDLYSLEKRLERQAVDISAGIALAVFALVLVASELVAASAKRRRVQTAQAPVFLAAFAANLSTAFLPLYALGLGESANGLSAALPVAARFLGAAATSVIWRNAGTGHRRAALLSAFLMGLGNLLAFYASNTAMLAAAFGVIGMASGFFDALCDTEASATQNQMAKMSGMSAACAAGSLGALYFGHRTVFLVGLCCAATLFFICLRRFKGDSKAPPTPFSIDFKAARFLLLCTLPYALSGAFLYYYFPLYGNSMGQNETRIALGFAATGLAAIYLGRDLPRLLCDRFPARRVALLGNVICFAGLALFGFRPALVTCYIAIGLLAVAASFGLCAQRKHLATLMTDSAAMSAASITIAVGAALGALVLSHFSGALALASSGGALLLILILFDRTERRV